MFRTNLAVLGENYFDYAIYDYSENVSYEKGDIVEHWTLERDVSIQIRLLYTGTEMFRITTLETEGEAKIAAYVNHKSIDVVLIPHFIREDYGQPIYTITRLAKKSFYSPINVQDLKVYVIPNTVNTIDAQVFMRAGAKEIYMTDSVTVLEYEAFAGITSLQKLVLSHNAVMAHGNPFTSMSVEKLYYTSTYQNWHTEYMDRFNIDYQQVYFYNTNSYLTPGYQYWMYDTNGIIIER